MTEVAVIPAYVFHVYILINARRTVFYTGCARDLKNRVYFHKKRLIPGFTKKYNVDRLVYHESFADVEPARLREKQIKGYSRAKKRLLVESMNPAWADLSPQLS